jgi:hypothetical protein
MIRTEIPRIRRVILAAVIATAGKCDAGGIADKRCHLCAFETPVDRFERRGHVAISAAIPATIS